MSVQLYLSLVFFKEDIQTHVPEKAQGYTRYHYVRGPRGTPKLHRVVYVWNCSHGVVWSSPVCLESAPLRLDGSARPVRAAHSQLKHTKRAPCVVSSTEGQGLYQVRRTNWHNPPPLLLARETFANHKEWTPTWRPIRVSFFRGRYYSTRPSFCL